MLVMLIPMVARAEIVDTYVFKQADDRIRAVNLAKSLRCPQCQNQNLVESTSPIAYDLRIEVYKMVDEGKTDEQIIQLMTERFGHFVRYNPPFLWSTALLWLLPLFLFIVAMFGVWRYSKTRKEMSSSNELSEQEQQELVQLLQQKDKL